MQQKRSQKIDVFDSFRKAMLEFFSTYNPENGEKRKKSTITHQIAVKLSKYFPASFSIDIDYMDADIVIKDNDNIVLILLWSNTYLTEKDKRKASTLHKDRNPLLTLAFSLLEDRDYILIYRFENEYLEYLHIDKSDFSEYLLKRSGDNSEKEKGQLMLGLRGKAGTGKRAKKKKVEETNNQDPHQ